MLDWNSILTNMGLGGLVVLLSFQLLSKLLFGSLLPLMTDIKEGNEEIKKIVNNIWYKLK